MANKNYQVRQVGTPKVAPVKKKDMQDLLQETSESAGELQRQMNGVKAHLNEQAKTQMDMLLAKMDKMPKEVDKATRLGIEKTVGKLNDEMYEIKLFVICGTIVYTLIATLILAILA